MIKISNSLSKNKMKLNKKGNINQGTIEKYIVIFLMVVVLFKVVATLIPEAQDAGDELNESGKSVFERIKHENFTKGNVFEKNNVFEQSVVFEKMSNIMLLLKSPNTNKCSFLS